jgi:hypothetical protein
MMKNLRNLLVWVMSGLLAVAVVSLGCLTLMPPPSASWTLEAYPAPMRLIIGSVALAGGLLLLVPRTTWLACILLGALVTGTLLYGESWQALAPSLLLPPLALLGYLRHPTRMFVVRLRAATDAFAEREIEASATLLRKARLRADRPAVQVTRRHRSPRPAVPLA